MSKIYIIYAHPNHYGHHGYFLKAITAILDREKCDYELLDLYKINYDPVLKEEELYSAGKRSVSQQNQEFQAKIIASDRLLFIYPTWWGGMPAILKGWVDRVFVSRFGFIYKLGIPIGQLKGKRAAVFSASGAPRLYSQLITGERALKSLTHDVLRFCGLKTRSFRLGLARNKSGDGEREMDKIAKKVYQYLRA